MKRRRPSEDPGKTAEREYKSIWKNKEQIFRGLERLEEISNSIQYEEGDIIGFTEEIEWLLDQIAQKGKAMLGSSSTLAQLEAQQLIVDVEGASYTERSNGFLKEIFEEEVRIYERLGMVFNAVIETADELDQEVAMWIEETKDGILTELELTQKTLTSILSNNSQAINKKSRKRPLLLRHESFIVKENTPVDQPPAKAVLQRQISVPHLRMPQKLFELQQPIYRHKASLSSVNKSSVQLNNEPADAEFSINRIKNEGESKSGSNRIIVTPPSDSTEVDRKKRKVIKDKDKDKDKDKKKKKKTKSVKETDEKASNSSKGSESKTDLSPRKDDQGKEEDQKDKKSSLTKLKSDDQKKKSNLSEEPKSKLKKSKSNLIKSDLTEDNENEEHKIQQKKDRKDDVPDDSGDDSALDSEPDGKSHKMRSRFSKLTQVFHKSKKSSKVGSATQSPIVRPRGSSPQGEVLTSPSSMHQLQESSSPPTLSLPSIATSGLASTENSIASPTMEQQQESIYKGVMIRTLLLLNLTTKDARTLYSMDDKAFIEYYESKILLVKEKLDEKEQ